MSLNKVLLKQIYELYLEDTRLSTNVIMRKFKISCEQAKEYLIQCMIKNHIEAARRRWKIYDKV